jgi:hypothetical protein
MIALCRTLSRCHSIQREISPSWFVQSMGCSRIQGGSLRSPNDLGQTVIPKVSKQIWGPTYTVLHVITKGRSFSPSRHAQPKPGGWVGKTYPQGKLLGASLIRSRWTQWQILDCSTCESWCNTKSLRGDRLSSNDNRHSQEQLAAEILPLSGSVQSWVHL